MAIALKQQRMKLEEEVIKQKKKKEIRFIFKLCEWNFMWKWFQFWTNNNLKEISSKEWYNGYYWT